MRRNNAQSSTGAEAARKARAPKTAEAKAARAARKKALGEMYADQLREVAAKLDITGRSGMGKAELVAAILKAEGGGKKRKTYTLTAAIKTRTANKLEARQGDGTFLLVLLDGNGHMVGELGPYAAARGAQVDAKSLLRRMVGKGAILSHEAAVEQIAEAPPGIKDMEKAVGGKVADGWITLDKETRMTRGEAWVMRIPKADSGLPADSKVQKLLRNTARNTARKNPRVSFRTADGRTVNFNARKNGAPVTAPRPRSNGPKHLTAAQAAKVDGLYAQARPVVLPLTSRAPNACMALQDALIFAVGQGKGAAQLVKAIEKHDAAGVNAAARAFSGGPVQTSDGRHVTATAAKDAARELAGAMR
jgi:hypothetical protein